jgi:transcriptional regulator with XRE-family HTH domain
MDKRKIGSFIALCRREKGLTQEQLAEQLQVTGKSVSKWETGLCLPDAAQYEPLCRILEITINELFAGQRIPAENYRTVADRNLLEMLKYQMYQLSDKKLTFVDFDNALTRISEIAVQLKAFPSKEDAVAFLMKETNSPRAECAAAYDFYTRLFDKEEKL